MAVPDGLLWDLQPHTKAKHDILEAYLKAWIPILGRYNSRIVYIDGFAGPGIYKGGEPGSPIIALQCAKQHQHRIKRNMTMVFIEKRKDRLENLKGELAKIDHSDNIETYFKEGEFEESIVSLLDDLETDGADLAPTFAFIDPFGFKGLPVELICRILSYRSTEVFVNYAIDSIVRFAKHPKKEIRSQIRRTIGRDLPPPLRHDENRQGRLRRAYAKSLGECASFVRSFEMYDKNNSAKYDLFFASNESKGHEKMKEAMWSVDPVGDFRFSDATDTNQTVLFDEDPVAQLLNIILEKYADWEKVDAGSIEQWVLDSTPFLKKHKTQALKKGEKEGLFLVKGIKKDGSRRSSGFPKGVVIDFTQRPGHQGSLPL